MITVIESFAQGHTMSRHEINIAALDAAGMSAVLEASPYAYNSHDTYEAERMARELEERGETTHGWSTFSTVRKCSDCGKSDIASLEELCAPCVAEWLRR